MDLDYLTFNSLYWVHIYRATLPTDRITISFNSLYWVRQHKPNTVQYMSSHLSIPFIGFGFIMHWGYILWQTFNSLYWVQVINLLRRKLDDTLLSIPFIGFEGEGKSEENEGEAFNSLYWVRRQQEASTKR